MSHSNIACQNFLTQKMSLWPQCQGDSGGEERSVGNEQRNAFVAHSDAAILAHTSIVN